MGMGKVANLHLLMDDAQGSGSHFSKKSIHIKPSPFIEADVDVASKPGKR